MVNRIYMMIFRLTITTILATGLSTMTGPAAAMPPHPDIQGKIRSGEVSLPFAKARIAGTESDLDAPARVNSPAYIGPFKALCIMVDFSDNPGVTASTEFDTLVFAAQTGTVRDYYNEVSYGRIDLVTVNLPSSLNWKRAPLTYAYYVDNNYGTDSPYPHNTQKLCEDLVDLVDAQIDFSEYDNDGDGYVDALLITHAGPGAEYTGQRTDIWSHKWSIAPRNRDGVSIYNYAIMPEFWSASGDMTIGVYCHELGHVLGLPDLYDTDGSSRGAGNWSLMATGSWNGGLGRTPAHPDPWCKIQAGWLTPSVVAANQTGVSIPAVESDATAFRLWTSGQTGNQYFLVENRQKSGYDAALPGSGLLIWHVDDGAANNNNEWYPGHTTSGHYKVALEQADNLYQLEINASAGDASDPFPGMTVNRSFNPTSAPSSDSYAPSSSFVAVSNISASAAVMTADFAVSLAAGNEDGNDQDQSLPDLWLGQNSPNPFNPVTVITYTLGKPGEAAISVYNICGEHVADLVSGHHNAGSYTVSWNGVDAEGRLVASGIYLYELVTDDGAQVRKMVFLK